MGASPTPDGAYALWGMMRDLSAPRFGKVLWEGRRLLRRRRPDAFLTIGPHSYVQRPKVIRYPGDLEPVNIGDYCSISGSSEILPGGNHNAHWISTFPFRIMFGMPGALEDGIPSSHGPVRIGNDVWIGRGAVVLSGVTIGDGAIVGARSVVAKDVRPYAVVVGNPATEIRRRFDDLTVDRLLESRWWDWPEEVVRSAAPLLCSDDLSAFFAFVAARAEGFDRGRAPQQ